MNMITAKYTNPSFMDDRFGLMRQFVDEQVKSLLAKKEVIIIEALRANGLEHIDIVEEAARRFPRFLFEKDDRNTEYLYYNDGSEKGKLILTFHNDFTWHTKEEGRTVEITMPLKYTIHT